MFDYVDMRYIEMTREPIVKCTHGYRSTAVTIVLLVITQMYLNLVKVQPKVRPLQQDQNYITQVIQC